MPTPYGPIEVAWAVDGTSVDLTLMTPTGVTATLQLPSGATLGGDGSHNGQVDVLCGMTQLKLSLG